MRIEIVVRKNNMSADEDTELRDLVAQTLESNGVLGKIRAQLRASVFLALEEQEAVQNKTPFLNHDLKSFLTTKEGQVVGSLVREFLEYFNLEFTQAVFEPESGLDSKYEGRSGLARELNLHDTDGAPKGPLLMEMLKRSSGDRGNIGRPIGVEEPAGNCSLPKWYENATMGQRIGTFIGDLTSTQLADARSKFEYYDRDKNGEIDKDELRELFLDMFPNFNKNMLDRYVNDEFRATDRDISNNVLFNPLYTGNPETGSLANSEDPDEMQHKAAFYQGISFQEFLSMYRRLFLQCRSVVAGDVADILSPTSPNKSVSSPLSNKGSISERSHVDSRNQRNLMNSLENGPKHVSQDNNTDTEEDFFDDPIPNNMSAGYKPYTSNVPESFPDSKRGSSPGRPSQIPVYSGLRSDERPKEKATSNGAGGQKGVASGKGSGSGMSSLQGLPSLTGDRTTGRKSRQLPVYRPRAHSAGSYSAQDTSENLRAMDKRMAELGLDGEAQDFSYEDDFQSSGMSQKSPRSRSEAKSQNGSIAEEIEEDIDDLSIEGDDLLRSEKSAFDDMTTDRTISQHESGFDYVEDLQSP